MDDGVAIEVIHGGHDAVLEFLFGCDADVAQHRAGELGEEAFDEIEPRAVLGRKDEFEATGGLASGMRKGHGSNPDFRIAIRDVKVRAVCGDHVLATYVEWQRNALASRYPPFCDIPAQWSSQNGASSTPAPWRRRG